MKSFHVDQKSNHCIPCRCKRQFDHKESKTSKKEGKLTLKKADAEFEALREFVLSLP